jgi:hypothetical protein
MFRLSSFVSQLRRENYTQRISLCSSLIETSFIEKALRRGVVFATTIRCYSLLKDGHRQTSTHGKRLITRDNAPRALSHHA